MEAPDHTCARRSREQRAVAARRQAPADRLRPGPMLHSERYRVGGRLAGPRQQSTRIGQRQAAPAPPAFEAERRGPAGQPRNTRGEPRQAYRSPAPGTENSASPNRGSSCGGGSAPSQRASPTQMSSSFERMAPGRVAFSRFSPAVPKRTTAVPSSPVSVPPTEAPSTGPPSSPLEARIQPSRTLTVTGSSSAVRLGPVSLRTSGEAPPP